MRYKKYFLIILTPLVQVSCSKHYATEKQSIRLYTLLGFTPIMCASLLCVNSIYICKCYTKVNSMIFLYKFLKDQKQIIPMVHWNVAKNTSHQEWFMHLVPSKVKKNSYANYFNDSVSMWCPSNTLSHKNAKQF